MHFMLLGILGNRDDGRLRLKEVARARAICPNTPYTDRLPRR